MIGRRGVLAGAAWLAAGGGVLAHDYKLGSIVIFHPWARASVGKTAGVYLGFKNGGEADRLIGVECAVAERAELHVDFTEGNIARMRRIDAVDVPAGLSLLKPGGTHIMLIDLKRPLKIDDRFKVRLIFEKAGAVNVEVYVDKPGAAEPAHDHTQ